MCLKMVVVVTVSENYIFENEMPPFSTAIVARMNFYSELPAKHCGFVSSGMGKSIKVMGDDI